MTTYENFKFDIDADGIALVTWDMPGRSMNVLANSMADMARSSKRSCPTTPSRAPC